MIERALGRFRFMSCLRAVGLFIVLASCVPGGTDAVWADVESEFSRDYPGSTVSLVVPDGLSAGRYFTLVIQFTRAGSTEEEYVKWKCEREGDKWVVVAKNSS